MARIMRIKRTGIRLGKGQATHEMHEVELDGLPAVEVEVAVPASVNRIKDEEKRTDRVHALVRKKAESVIAALEHAHAG